MVECGRAPRRADPTGTRTLCAPRPPAATLGSFGRRGRRLMAVSDGPHPALALAPRRRGRLGEEVGVPAGRDRVEIAVLDLPALVGADEAVAVLRPDDE